jgi:hypothetical protein
MSKAYGDRLTVARGPTKRRREAPALQRGSFTYYLSVDGCDRSTVVRSSRISMEPRQFRRGRRARSRSASSISPPIFNGARGARRATAPPIAEAVLSGFLTLVGGMADRIRWRARAAHHLLEPDPLGNGRPEGMEGGVGSIASGEVVVTSNNPPPACTPQRQPALAIMSIQHPKARDATEKRSRCSVVPGRSCRQSRRRHRRMIDCPTLGEPSPSLTGDGITGWPT